MGLAEQVGQTGNPPRAFQIIAFGASGTGLAIVVKNGLVVLNGAGAVLSTLALPVAGSQTKGGDDGKILEIISNSAQTHTVITPAAGINGASTTLTFVGAIGNGARLVAFNGTWLVLVVTNKTTPAVVIS